MSEARAPFTLTVLNQPFEGRKFPLPARPEPVFIGRGEENDIVLDLPSISRRHASLHWDRGRYRIMDEGSRNGIQVDGRVTRDSFLVPGCTVGIGDVLFRLDGGQSKAATGPPATIPGPAGAGAMLERAPAEPGIGAPTGGPVRTGRMVVLLTLVGLAMVVVIVGAWAYLTRAGRPRVLVLDPVMVRINEHRWLPTSAKMRAGGKNIVIQPDFLGDSIRVGDSDTAEVRKFEGAEGELVVTGKSSGSTDAELLTPYGNVLRLRIIVRGRLNDPLEPYRRLPDTLTVRRPVAEEHLAQGNRLANADPYAALTEYRIAREAMNTDALRVHRPYGEAKDKVETIEAAIEKRYLDLTAAVRQARALNDLTGYDKCLAQILQLIPDENDPRHQRAALARQGRIMAVESR